MKRAIFAMMMAAGLAVSTGCQTTGAGCSDCGSGGCQDGACLQGALGSLGGHRQCEGCQEGCESCRGNGAHPRLAALKRHLHGDPDWMNAGPPSAAVSYPYYTTRGPRDFFEPNPPTIGR